MQQEFDGSENQPSVFGDAFDSPLAATLKALAQTNPNDELLGSVGELQAQQQLGVINSHRVLLSDATKKLEEYGLRLKKEQTLRERATRVEELTPRFEQIGRTWENVTFYRPAKKAGLMVSLQATWADLYPMIVTCSPENRDKMLRSLARGLNTSEDKPSRTHNEHIEFQFNYYSSHPAKIFWDHVHPRIPLSGPSMIFTIAFLELNGYPTDHTAQIEAYFGQADVMSNLLTEVDLTDRRKGKLYGAEVTLESFIDKLNAWYTENYQLNNLVDLRSK